MLAPDVVPHLATQFRRAQVVLFTGAGFSQLAKNVKGEPVPTLRDLRLLLWNVCFPGEAPDEESSVQDLYLYAYTYKQRELTDLLKSSLTVDANTVPPEYSIWLSFP